MIAEGIISVVELFVSQNDVEKLTTLKDVLIEKREFELAAYVRSHEKMLIEREIATPKLRVV
jgi:hypothetical protein